MSQSPDLVEGNRLRQAPRKGLSEVRTASQASDSKTSGGTGQVIEVSAQECLVAMLELSLLFYTYMGLRTSRLGGRLLGTVENL